MSNKVQVGDKVEVKGIDPQFSGIKSPEGTVVRAWPSLFDPNEIDVEVEFAGGKKLTSIHGNYTKK